jgi:hypothetical protein
MHTNITHGRTHRRDRLTMLSADSTDQETMKRARPALTTTYTHFR